VKLTDIAEQIIERVDNPQDSKLIDYIGLEHIESDNLKIPQYGKTSDVTSSKFECKKGDIIFGRRRAYLRKLAISDKDALVSTAAIIVRPKTGVLKEFLIIIMQSDKFWEEAISRSAGSLSPRVKWKDIGNFKVTLPPVKKQEEISNSIFSIQENIERSERLIRVCKLFRIEFMIDTLRILGAFITKIRQYSKGLDCYENSRFS
jgi:type I restriction enzyme S subunit